MVSEAQVHENEADFEQCLLSFLRVTLFYLPMLLMMMV
jgi:hypothetical protein